MAVGENAVVLRDTTLNAAPRGVGEAHTLYQVRTTTFLLAARTNVVEYNSWVRNATLARLSSGMFTGTPASMCPPIHRPQRPGTSWTNRPVILVL